MANEINDSFHATPLSTLAEQKRKSQEEIDELKSQLHDMSMAYATFRESHKNSIRELGSMKEEYATATNEAQEYQRRFENAAKLAELLFNSLLE